MLALFLSTKWPRQTVSYVFEDSDNLCQSAFSIHSFYKQRWRFIFWLYLLLLSLLTLAQPSQLIQERRDNSRELVYHLVSKSFQKQYNVSRNFIPSRYCIQQKLWRLWLKEVWQFRVQQPRLLLLQQPAGVQVEDQQARLQDQAGLQLLLQLHLPWLRGGGKCG